MKDTDKIEIQKIQLSEWQRKYDAQNASYDKIRNRSISLLVAQFGFAGFALTQLNVVVKHELYGQIFLIFGVILLVLSVVFSARNYVAKGWHSPMYSLEIEKINNSKTLIEAYGVLLDDYRGCYDRNHKTHESSAFKLNYSVYLFAASAIITLTLMLA